MLDCPTAVEAKADLIALRRFRQFIEKVIGEEKCDLARVLKGSLAMEKIASTAISNAATKFASVGPMEAPSGTELNESHKISSTSVLRMLLKSLTEVRPRISSRRNHTSNVCGSTINE